MPNSAFAFEIKSLTEAGEFSGLASVYDVRDLQGDIVAKGAFQKTLSASRQRPLLFEHHDTIGIVALEDSERGLIARGKLTLGVQKAKEAYLLLKDRAIEGMSIGYETIKSDFEGENRILREVKIWEVSLTTFPANPAATVTAIKTARATSITAALDELRNGILRGLEV